MTVGAGGFVVGIGKTVQSRRLTGKCSRPRYNGFIPARAVACTATWTSYAYYYNIILLLHYDNVAVHTRSRAGYVAASPPAARSRPAPKIRIDIRGCDTPT